MKEHKDTYVVLVDSLRLMGAVTFTLMKHKHKGHAYEWRHHDY